MRSRNIKPGFFHNEELVECSFPARLLFVGLWCLADRAGYLEDRPKKIKIQVFPADNVDSEELLGELSGANLIKRYIAADRKYIWIPGFRSHQNPHRREKPSTIPPHPDDVERRPAHEGEGADPEDEKQGQDPSKDMPRTDQGQTQDEPGHGRARLIPDTGILIPDSLNPDSGNLKEKTLCDESHDGQPGEEFYLTAKKKKLTGKRLETFEQFWAAFDYKKSKASAADSWLAIPELKPSIVALIVKAAEAEAKNRPAMVVAGKTPKMAQGWLTERRWEDEPPSVDTKVGVQPRQGRRLQGDELLQANTKAAEDFLRRNDGPA